MSDLSTNIIPPLVTVSIVTWNHAYCIADCIDSILNQTHQNIKIIIRDNDSHDGTQRILHNYADRTSIHLGASNLGFCGGHNKNLLHTKGEFVLLANPDVVFDASYIEQALIAFNLSSQVGTVCGVLFQEGWNKSGALLDGAGLAVGRDRRFFLVRHGQTERALPETDFEVFGADGAAPMYRDEMIQDVMVADQFFDENFFAHKEDHDISWRARLFGWKTVCARKAIALHPRHFRPGNLKVRRQIGREVRYHAVKNQFLLQLKNEHAANVWLDLPWIAGRQLAIFFYVLLFEWSSLRSYGFIIRNIGGIIRQRRQLRRRRTATYRDIRQWIGQSWKPLG